VDALVALLREDAVMTMPPLPTLLGADAIGRFFRDLCEGGDIGQISVKPTRANGRPGVIMRRAQAGEMVPHGILLDVEGAAIGGLDTYLDGSLVALFERAS
jgi:hypothetical protein